MKSSSFKSNNKELHETYLSEMLFTVIVRNCENIAIAFEEK